MLDLNQIEIDERPPMTVIPDKTVVRAMAIPEPASQNGVNFDSVSNWYFKWPEDNLVKLKFKFKVLFGKDQEPTFSNRYVFNDLAVGAIDTNHISDGDKKKLNMGGKQLLNIINEKLGLDPMDKSDATCQKRMISDPADFKAEVCIRISVYTVRGEQRNGCFILNRNDKDYITSQGKPYVKQNVAQPSQAMEAPISTQVDDEIPF